MTIAEFQATSDAKEWYRVVNSDLFQRVLKVANDNAPSKRLGLVGNTDIKEVGHILAAQIQGWEEALTFLSELLIKSPEPQLPDPTYQEDA